MHTIGKSAIGSRDDVLAPDWICIERQPPRDKLRVLYAGKVRMLAVATPRRSALVPELPSMAEAGVTGFAMTISLGILAPSKTPREEVDRLNAEIMKAVNAPDTQQRLYSLGVEASPPSSPDQFAETMRSENQLYGKRVRESGIRVE